MTSPLLSADLVAVLRCPRTGQRLRIADAGELARLVESAGPMHPSDPPGTAGPPEAALITEDGTLAYPVRNGFPILLVDEGVTIGTERPTR